MSFSFLVDAIFVSALLSLCLSVFILTRPRVPGSFILGLMALAVTFWSLGYAIQVGAVSLETKDFGTYIAIVGIAYAPFLWFLFTLAYSGKANHWKKFKVYWLGFIPLITIGLVWTSKLHDLILFNPRIEAWHGLSILMHSYGPWFWGHTVVSYLFILVGTITLLNHLGHKPGLYRTQILALIAASVLPWIGNIYMLVSGSKIDPTPFTFMLAVGIVVWTILGYHLIDIAPIARDLIIDGLREGLIVVDLRGHIVDMNAAAAHLVGLNIQQTIGQPVTEVLKPWQSLFERFSNKMDVNEVVEIGTGQAIRKIGVRLTTLRDEHKKPIGQILSFWEMEQDPQPQQTVLRMEEPITQASVKEQLISPSSVGVRSLWRALMAFFSPPVIEIQSRLHPSPRWTQTIERVFTIIIRVLAVLGTLALLFSLPTYPRTEVVFLLALFILIAVLWFLGLARGFSFGLRISIFFLVMYALTLRELVNFGFSPEGFALSLAFVALATLLAGLRGGQFSFGIIFVTLLVIGVSIGAGWYQPLSVPSALTLPTSLDNFVQSITVFSVLAGGLAAAVYTLLNSLNYSLQKETQTLNLLQQERDLLDQRVQERTIELAQARDRALEASRFKSQLIAKVSHELRTPLGGVLGYAELLEQGVYGELTQKQQNAANDIVTSANYLNTMINELLDQAQIDARAVKIQIIPFAPSRLLKSVNANMTILAHNKGLRFISEIDPSLPQQLMGDERRLQQVLFNLAGNAIKFTDHGEVKVSLQRCDEAQWAMRVADTGAGIPKDAQDFIFESFRQLDNAVTRDNRGTGLGLSIAKQLVELMGGKIELQSEVGQGSIFTVLLPILVPDTKGG